LKDCLSNDPISLAVEAARQLVEGCLIRGSDHLRHDIKDVDSLAEDCLLRFFLRIEIEELALAFKKQTCL
jgi:hypothetical protein